MKKVIAYLRVSTESQVGDEKYGLNVQREAIRKYCEEHDMEIVAEFKDVVSGCADVKPEWDKLIVADNIVNPPFEAIVVFKSDRISRRIEQYFYYFYKLQIKGVELISTQEDFGGDNAVAGIMRSLMLFVAEQERKNIALRTSHGRKIKASAGGYAGGKPPFGYYVKEGRLLVDEFERPVIEMIFSSKGSYRDIVKAVNEKGYKQRNGKPFTVGVIYQIILNKKTYQGYYRYGKDAKWVKGVHEAIVK